jgi:hypothetical protein
MNLFLNKKKKESINLSNIFFSSVIASVAWQSIFSLILIPHTILRWFATSADLLAKTEKRSWRIKFLSPSVIASLPAQAGVAKQSIFFLVVCLFFTIPSLSRASVNINLNVEGCNNNNICELPDENTTNCSNDCTSCNHNNVCELLKGESVSSCSSDCNVTGGPLGPASVPVVTVGTILDIKIKTGINNAVISWNTAVPTQGSVRWGKGDSFDGSIINSLKIDTHHEISIENLSPNTKYSFSINSSLPKYYYAISLGTFSTLSIPNTKYIPSILNFTSTSTSNEIIFKWTNPTSSDFYGVKIVRSPFFFPTNPLDGKIIYDGNGSYARDTDFSFDTKYYYSAFSYDKDLNFSPGALMEFFASSNKVATSTEIFQNIEKPIVNLIPINKFVFLQGDIELPVFSGTVRIYPHNSLKIVIDENNLPANTKSLILNVYNKDGYTKVLSYSFKADPLKKIFYLEIPNFEIKKMYSFSITSYGLDNKETSLLKGVFDVKAVEETKATSILDNTYFVYGNIIVLLLIFIAFFVRIFTKKPKI